VLDSDLWRGALTIRLGGIVRRKKKTPRTV
jgi:hypothetical protein